MRKLNEFKVNVFYNNNGKTLQELMNDLFTLFVKNKTEDSCNSTESELTYLCNN